MCKKYTKQFLKSLLLFVYLFNVHFFFFLQDIYKYYVLDVPACTWARRYSSTQYTLPDSEQLAEVDNFVVLKKVIFYVQNCLLLLDRKWSYVMYIPL